MTSSNFSDVTFGVFEIYGIEICLVYLSEKEVSFMEGRLFSSQSELFQ